MSEQYGGGRYLKNGLIINKTHWLRFQHLALNEQRESRFSRKTQISARLSLFSVYSTRVAICRSRPPPAGAN
ncbi:hypothetical protein [Caballeronia novacaledonica]|uniref:hypothetical protein n=1 Tax=Caballeronia novacaledonica TaxID=1544861 RepID=UPI0011B220ED|nr:hypothetical protein [Caballeronia novacaledonica]